MSNIQISIYLPEEWVVAADGVAEQQSRTRNFILNRWLENGMALERGGKWRRVGSDEVADLEKNSEVPAQDVPRRRAADRRRGVVVDSGSAGFVTEMVPFETLGSRVVKVEDQTGKVLTKAEVEALGSPEPGFDTSRYFSKPENDFPVVGFREDMDEAKHAQFRKEFVDGMEAVQAVIKKVDADLAGEPTPGFDTIPKVPDEAFAVAKHLQDTALTGADPRILNQSENPHARTLKGVAAAEQQRAAKSKKIAKVAPPVRSTVQRTVPDSGSDHDPNTCRMYGCLMCKLAKEGK